MNARDTSECLKLRHAVTYGNGPSDPEGGAYACTEVSCPRHGRIIPGLTTGRMYPGPSDLKRRIEAMR